VNGKHKRHKLCYSKPTLSSTSPTRLRRTIKGPGGGGRDQICIKQDVAGRLFFPFAAKPARLCFLRCVNGGVEGARRNLIFDEQFRATGKMRGGTVDRAELFRKSGGATSNVKCTTWQSRRVGRVLRPVRKLHGYKCFQQRSVPTCTYTGKGKLT
jgi:hypothetical protein